uniref:Transmembrane protein n=1 Tax=Heterorhabditis bacteriophora TaxID=37862 RepID=A0A1I7WXE1_HETBA
MGFFHSMYYFVLLNEKNDLFDILIYSCTLKNLKFWKDRRNNLSFVIYDHMKRVVSEIGKYIYHMNYVSEGGRAIRDIVRVERRSQTITLHGPVLRSIGGKLRTIANNSSASSSLFARPLTICLMHIISSTLAICFCLCMRLKGERMKSRRARAVDSVVNVERAEQGPNKCIAAETGIYRLSYGRTEKQPGDL